MFETLITHYESPLYFGAQMAQDAGIPEAEFQALWQPTDEDRTLGNRTLEEVLEMIFRTKQCYSEELVERIAGRRTKAKEMCFDHLHPEILPMLASLKEKGILVGLISNCYSEEAKVIRESVLFPWFDCVCLSCEQKLRKPDPRIFLRCVDEMGVVPGECVYVGDGGSQELEAAAQLGMKPVQAVWYLKDGTMQPTGRKSGFEQAQKPLDVLKYLEE